MPKRTTKPAITYAGIGRSLRAAPNSHRFSRWTATQDLVTFDSGTYIGLANNPDNGAVTIPLTVTGGAATADTSGVGNSYMCGGAMQFRITDLPGYTDFTNLFDQYRIDQVDVEISHLFNSSTSGGSPGSPPLAGATMPTVMYCPDFDDAVVPTSQTQLAARQRTKQWTFRGDGGPLKFSVKPRIASLVYKTSGTTIGYTVADQSTWVNQAFTDVPSYGVKLWFQDMFQTTGGPTGMTHFRVKMRYHLSCKDPE